MTPTTERKTRQGKRSPAALLITLGIILIAALILLQPPTYMRGVPGDPQNPEPEGTMAVAQVLGTHGVEVKVVRSVSSAIAGETGTLVVSNSDLLSSAQLRALADLGTDTVFIDATRDIPSFLTSLSREGVSSSEATSAGCEDPRAGAGAISVTGPLLSAPGAQACFPGDGAGVMLTWRTDDGAQATILPGDLLTNSNLTAEANAALALRVLGEAPLVTWLVAEKGDPYGSGEVAELSLTWLWASIGVMLAAFIWWRAPRFGRLAGEPLPVIVNASETTIGRGHLYRRASDLDHAAISLRLGTLNRVSARIGLPRKADPPEVIARLARATGGDPSRISHLLYGPAPDSPQSLHALALALDALEDEVDQV